MRIRYYDDKEVGGIRGWYWIESDTGAWIGPKFDWEQSHFPIIQRYVVDAHDKIAVQAGGNLGMYPKLLSSMFKYVYTFEPDPLNFLCLTMNCLEENIIKQQAAVGSSSGEFCMVERITMENVGMHRVKDEENAPNPIVAIDSYNFNNVGLLMLDIELYEYQALLGAVDTISRSRPVIFIENANEQIVALLNKLEYHEACKSKMDTVFIPN